MVSLSLDCLTLTKTCPADVIAAAGEAGFDLVSLSVQHPPLFAELLVSSSDRLECAKRLADSGLGVHSLEFFDLASKEAIAGYRAALELGARLGGKAALAMHLGNQDRDEAADLLAHFVEVAAEYDLAVNLEPVAMGQTATLEQARDLIASSGADAGILFDAWHLLRAGGGPEDIRTLEPGLIRYVQFNDGLIAGPPADMVTESIEERLYPGEGEFPLAEIAALLPRDMPWAIECPSLRRHHAGVGPAGQAREAMAALQGILSSLDP